APPAPAIYALSLHDALPIWVRRGVQSPDAIDAIEPIVERVEIRRAHLAGGRHEYRIHEREMGLSFVHVETGSPHLGGRSPNLERSEEHTSELQSRFDLVCRL